MLGIEIDDGLQGDKYEMLGKEQEVDLGMPKTADNGDGKKTNNRKGHSGSRSLTGDSKGEDKSNKGSDTSPTKTNELNLKASKQTQQQVTRMVGKIDDKIKVIEESVGSIEKLSLIHI